MFDLNKLGLKPISGIDFHPPASDKQIEELEQYIGNKLPESYKEILKKYNGCFPAAAYFDVIDEATSVPLEYEIGDFYSLDNHKELLRNVWWVINAYPEFFPKGTLPFAYNIHEHIFFMKWANNIPEIWCLDYYYVDEPELTKVANSFDELLGALYVPK